MRGQVPGPKIAAVTQSLIRVTFLTHALPCGAQSQAATLARVEQLEAEALAAREAYSAELSALTAELGSTQEVRA